LEPYDKMGELEARRMGDAADKELDTTAPHHILEKEATKGADISECSA
jgi:hypothetical protein